MIRATEYDVRIIDESGDASDSYLFGGSAGKRSAIKFAKLRVRYGDTVVVERVEWSFSDDWSKEIEPRVQTVVWTGGEREWLQVGGWLADDCENGGAA